ncbi:MAG: hypothetical protein KDD34_00910, partial [Bdellovibrionales bacterium]|nr:hypothetical protein [Bdellovibrionales bacterium]
MAITNIYNTSALFFEDLIHAIDQATSEVLLEYYIFHRDSQIGHDLINALERASRRGVQVRLLLDGIGSLDWFYRANAFSTNSTVQVFIFNPVPWPMVYFLGLKASSVDRFLKYWSRVNQKNNKKVAIIDQSRAFIGSMNIHEETFHWQEMGVQIDAQELTLLRSHFFGLCEDAMEIQRGT